MLHFVYQIAQVTDAAVNLREVSRDDTVTAVKKEYGGGFYSGRIRTAMTAVINLVGIAAICLLVFFALWIMFSWDRSEDVPAHFFLLIFLLG
jgi:hypothetical protein